MVKLKCILFGVFLHDKIEVHSKESYSIVLATPIPFKEIKELLHCKMSSKKENTIVI